MTPPHTLAELAVLVAGEVTGDGDVVIHGFNGIDLAGSGELTYITSPKMVPRLQECRASACIVPMAVNTGPMPLIRVADPELAAAVIHNHLLAAPFVTTGVHPSAVVGKECDIPAEVAIGPLACIGDRVRLGSRVTLEPGVVIGDDVEIGDDTVLHANVVVARGCRIGSRVIIHHGAVIGSDGFGFATDTRGCHVKKPQVGTVRIDDDVEIGANTCIDRAAFGTTRIRSGVKIDNLVQVAHNVDIGENSILVAQVGIAGSTTLGRNVVLGAKAGIAGHLHLADRVMVAAKGGVHNSQPEGAVVGGTPAMEIKTWGRASAAYSRLPGLVREVRRLRRELDRLVKDNSSRDT